MLSESLDMAFAKFSFASQNFAPKPSVLFLSLWRAWELDGLDGFGRLFV